MPGWGAAIVYAGLLAGALERAAAADASIPFWLPLQVSTASDPQAAAAAAPIYQQYLPAGRGFDWTRAGYQEGKLPIPYPTANILNVKFKRFGAKGDGKADDSAALQAQRAFAEANRSPAGAIIYLPAGTYRLRRPLAITNSKVVLRGDGERRTTILIPISLGDYFKGSWTQTPGGKIVSQWSSGGAFITFEGKRQRSNNDRTRLARIRSAKVVPRYSRTIPVSSTAEFKLGQRIRIFLNDKSTVSRRRLLAENATDAAAAGVAATAGGVLLQRRRPPAWVLAHPVYRSAQRKLASLGDPGEGLSPAAAAAADADFARRYGAEGGVQSAAAPGTLVAWLYGGNLVDSGPNTGVIDTDEIQCRAVVAGIGRGTVTLDRPLCFSIDPRWQTSIHEDVPTLQQGAVEKLTIRFKHTLNMPHHGDKGFNALEVNFASNFWIRNVTILNADNGIFFSWGDRSTLIDVKAGVTAPRVNPRWPDSRNGHHPFTIEESRDCMLRRFELRNTFIHDVTVTSGSSLNVIMEGRGVDLNLDHHRTAPWGNLFTDLSLGLGTRPFKSGGNKARGAYSGLLNTYYNLRKADGSAVALPDCNFGPLLNFRGKLSGNKCASSKWYVAPLPSGGPANLYWAQRKARVAAEQAAARARGRG